MTNIASSIERSMDRFGDYEAVVHVALSGPDAVHRSVGLHAQAVRVASVLPSLGVEPGDRVMVMIPNTPEVGALYTGIARCGAVILPVLFLIGDAELSHIIRDAEPKVVITTTANVERVRTAASGLDIAPHLITIDAQKPVGTLSLEEITGTASADVPIVDRGDDDLALLIYTGGTSGAPKGVMHTHGSLAHAMRSAAEVSKRHGMGSQDTSCSALPLAHAYGVLVWLAGTQIGGRTVLMPWFEAGTWLRCVEEYACTTSPLVPAMLRHLLDHPDARLRDTSSLRVITTGAAALPAEVEEAFERRFGCVVLQGWGLTESLALGTLNQLTRRKRGSIGLPVDGAQLSVRAPDGDEDLGPGEVGEICMRGPHVMAGYWRLADQTRIALRGGWLRTGDVGSVDPDGFFSIVDRLEDLISRRGSSVFPREVEEVLQRHPAVLEAAAVGVPDSSSSTGSAEEELRAFVVLKGGEASSEDELYRHCRKHLPEEKCPVSIVFLDALPKTGVGKILRRQLRETVVGST